MSERSIPLSDATHDQLVKFAQNHLGMTIHPATKPETLLAKIRQAWSKDNIPVSDDPPSDQSGTAPQARGSEHGKVRLILQRTEEPGGDEAVPVGVNGRVMLIPRGQEVEVPYPYFEVLKNAVRDIYDPLPDGRGVNPVPRQVPAFPYQRVA